MPGEIEPASSEPETSENLPNLPFPEPEMLREYEQVLPGFGHRWMTAWERALDRSYDLRVIEVQEFEKTSRRAWYTRELRLVIFGALSVTYLFVGLVVGIDSRAMAFLAIIAVGTAFESIWRRIQRRIQAKRDED